MTGTLSDGAFAVGETVEVMPTRLAARIRGMQSHHQAVESSEPGSRLALNLTGVSVRTICIAAMSSPSRTRSNPTMLIDTSFRLLPDAARA